MFEASSPSSAFTSATAISVGDLLQRARAALDRALPLLWVAGEISGFKRAASGHCYFDLKDDQGSDAQIACVLYRHRAALVGVELRDGVHVDLRLRAAIYEPRGSLQFMVEQARLAGIGRLYEQFLRVKAKLQAEGLFDASRKRTLPPLPMTVGLVTSLHAAALADLLRVLRDRWPRLRVVIYPSLVQGVDAPGQLIRALATANARRECDLLVIARGGGSAEDLWAFNDETLARAIAASALPVVSAVGHETDFSLCDLVADVRAPTPSAAAALVVPERRALIGAVEQLGTRMQWAVRGRLDRLQERVDRAAMQCRSSAASLQPWRERLLRLSSLLPRALMIGWPVRQRRLDNVARRLLLSDATLAISRNRLAPQALALRTALADRLSMARRRVSQMEHALALLNPDRVLARGYAIVQTATGEPVSCVADVLPGHALSIHLDQCTIDAEVVAVRSHSTDKVG
ncbi:MAG: exodeoxyribonuclease VII large subunit [Burkholderiales bacterium]|nr:exodeoxyribonuclease VII large subunit [Burkholderiales bacterium]